MSSLPINRPARPRRPWYQFSLRSVLVLITLIVLGLVAWRSYIEPYRHERQVMRLIEDLGGRYTTETRGPSWLVKVFGTDHFQAVIFGDLADCDEPRRYLPAISRCPWLEVLVIGGDDVGDEEVVGLRRLNGLRALVLDSTSASDNGIQQLQDALPDLAIYESQRRAIAALKHLRPAPSQAEVQTRRAARPAALPDFVTDEYFDLAVQVQVMDFDRRRLTNAELSPLRALVDLETFGLRGNSGIQITDAGLANLAAAKNLRVLFLLGATQVSQFDWLPKAALQEVMLVATGLTDEGLGRLPLEQLRHLALDYCKLTEAGVRMLDRCRQLESLQLDGLPLTDDSLAALAGLAKLELLGVSNTPITDDGLKHVARLRNLRQLELGRTKITNAGLAQLSPLGELRHLGLNAQVIDASGLRHLAALPKLEDLFLGYLGGESRIDDAAAAEIAKLKGLHHLDLDGSKITDAGLALLGRELPNLWALDLNGTDVTAQALSALSKARPRLSVSHFPRPKTTAGAQ